MTETTDQYITRKREENSHTHQDYWDDSPCPAGCGSISVRWRDDIDCAICYNCHYDRTEEFLKLLRETDNGAD